MRNVMNEQQVKNRVTRNGYDLSRNVGFTAKFGELLPIDVSIAYPGEKHRLGVSQEMRTRPMNAPTYSRMRQYYDFYFVPFRLLWPYANEWFAQIGNQSSIATSIKSGVNLDDMFPYILRSEFADYIKKMNEADRKNFFDFNRAALSCKLTNYLGWNFSTIKQKPVSSEQFIDKPVLTINSEPESDMPVSLAALFAYQKIYFDHYRFTQWENNNPATYNVNYLTSNTHLDISSLSTTEQKNYNMFDLRYCNYPKDMFMGLLPRAQYGSTASAAVEDTYVDLNGHSWSAEKAQFTFDTPQQSSIGAVFSSRGAYPADKGYLNTSPGDRVNLRLEPTDQRALYSALKVGVQSAVSVLELRKAEALQKFKEITLSNELNYSAQMEAHFGAKVSKIHSNMSMYLGGQGFDIQTNAITNTNFTEEDNSFPVIKGNGYSAGRTEANFVAPEHGLIVTMYHATVAPEYELDTPEPVHHLVHISNFMQPEFDKLGAEVVPNNWVTGAYVANTTGYMPRYGELKTNFDKVLGDFNSSTGGTSPQYNTPVNLYAQFYGRALSDIHPDLQARSFKLDPHVVDPLFGVVSDSTPATDQLLCNCYLKHHAVRPLDRNGLPY